MSGSGRIPNVHIDAVRLLASAPEEDIERLVSLLVGASSSLQYEDFVKAAINAFSGREYPEESIRDVVDFLISIHSASDINEVSMQSLIEYISDSVSNEEELSELRDKGSLVNDRLTLILDSGSILRVLSKAYSLKNDYGGVFLSSRLVTDMRPIFDDDELEQGVISSIVSHVLRIDYREGRESKSFYVALDDEDLEYLSQQLARGKSKSKIVRERFRLMDDG